jgi:DNA (cytosine-5)-methyltransferase 1
VDVYYNENDPYAAQWLRNLIAAGHIAQGHVDERSIVDVRPADLDGYTQCHFFAGIGGWSYALRLAGWPDDCPVWTGSCPCQPLSGIGKRLGHVDERHLWPTFYGLIAECSPTVLFGEQVESKDGREWLSAVRADLEAQRYAVGIADIPAASQGAWHARQRLWFVAHHDGDRQSGPLVHVRQRRQVEAAAVAVGIGALLSDDDGAGQPNAQGVAAAKESEEIRVGSSVDDSQGTRTVRWPSEPGVGRVVHGVPETVDQLRAFGNAIVPQVAAQFIGACMELE